MKRIHSERKTGCPLTYRYNRSHTFSMKTAISIPDKIFIAAEGFAKRLGISRSELYSKAIQEFLETHKNQNVTEKLNLIYSEISSETGSSEIDKELASLQSKSIPEEKW